MWALIVMGVLIAIVVITLICYVAAQAEQRKNEHILEQAAVGEGMFKTMLANQEIKTLQAAIGHPATIHRLYHIQADVPRSRATGIRSSCEFCHNLVSVAEAHFST